MNYIYLAVVSGMILAPLAGIYTKRVVGVVIGLGAVIVAISVVVS